MWAKAHPILNGAGDGARTHIISLEGWGSTIELRPRKFDAEQPEIIFIKLFIFSNFYTNCSVLSTSQTPVFAVVEGVGFEPTKAKPADLQSAPVDRLGTPPRTWPTILFLWSIGVNKIFN